MEFPVVPRPIPVVMISFITSIPDRVKNFLFRNKVKIGISSICLGGVYYYYRETIWQMIEMYRLMKEMEKDNKVDDGVERRRESMKQIVNTGDDTAKKHLQNFRNQICIDMYGVDLGLIQEKLKQGGEEREEWFQKLHVLTYARLVSCIVFFHLIFLLARIEVCLIGRSNRVNGSNEDDRRADHRELLSSLRILSTRETIENIDKVSREVTTRVFRENRMMVTENVKLDRLVGIVDKIVVEVVSAGRKSGWSWLLGSLGSKNLGLSPIVCETLDILESPQFTQLVSFLSRNAAKEALARSLASGGSVKGAVLIPAIRNEPESILSVEGEYYDRFVESEVVDEFCQSVYFAENTEDVLSSSSSDNTPAEMEAKLGTLLEKLVKADIEKK